MKTLVLLPVLLAAVTCGCGEIERVHAGETTNSAALAAPASSVVTNAPPPSVTPPEISESDGAPAAPPDLPNPVSGIVELAQSTVGEQVLIDFVATINEPYSLTVEQVIYLKDLGLSDEVIGALLKRQVALGGAPVALADVEAEADGAAVPKIALTNAPGTDIGLVTSAPAPAPAIQPNAPEVGESPDPGTAQPAAISAPGGAVNYNVFYNSLSPYGTWVEVPDYGWCWQPTVTRVNVSWRPYSDNGRWVWSTSGWYWHSYYSWGWAPFHYGRWCSVPARGWCWVPGTVWGPSWVSWRHCNDHFGWAPLPPACGWQSGVGLTYHGSAVSVGFSFGLAARDYCFVPRHRFYDPHCYRFRARHEELAGLFHRSTAVNDYGFHNSRIINRGFGHDQVQKHTRDEIRPVALASAKTPGRPQMTGLRPGQPGSRLDVYRPSVVAGSVVSKPPASVLARQETRPSALSNRARTDLGSRELTGRRSESMSTGRGAASPAITGRRDLGSSAVGREGRQPANRPLGLTGRTGSQIGTPTGVQNGSSSVQRPSGVGNYSGTLPGRSIQSPETTVPASPGRPLSSSANYSRVSPSPGNTTTQVAPQRGGYGGLGTSRSEVRPNVQSDLTIRRQSPVLQTQPAPASPGGSRPTFTQRYSPAPVTRGPSDNPATRVPVRIQQPTPAPSIVRPQIQAPAVRSAPQVPGPSRAYSPPAASSRGSSAARPTGQRTQPQ